MTHWGWNDTDEEYYSSETEDLSTDCEYIEVSGSSTEEEEKVEKKEDAILPEKKVSIQPEAEGLPSEALQRTYSNLSGICRPSISQNRVEVLRPGCWPNSPEQYRGNTSTFNESSTRKWS